LNLLSKIGRLINQDSKLKVDNYQPAVNPKDPDHLIRKQQQRAIPKEYILLALNYGKLRRTYGDLSYTLLDKSLRNTPYKSYVDRLRGTTVIGFWQQDTFYVKTCFWNFDVKTKCRY
jgi:hypothetical protein